jgi:hypothetical protein
MRDAIFDKDKKEPNDLIRQASFVDEYKGKQVPVYFQTRKIKTPKL